MNIMRHELGDPVFGVTVADEPDELNAIHNPECAATIWRRAPRPAFQNWINALRPDALPQARLIIRPHLIRETVASICDDAGLIKDPMRDILVGDITALADTFVDIMKAPYLRLRLDIVTGNACKKFHIDALTARLICTYRGTGTQYGLASDGGAPQRIFTVPTGAPIILRGTEYPTSPKSDLLHRSPPIEGTDEVRLVLVLDPIHSPDVEV